jgi:membrane fusion protein (multidrug efflux system)
VRGAALARPGSVGALVACAALLALAGCKGESKAPVAAGRPVVAKPVVAATIEERIEATGQLVAKSEAQIAAEVGGQVTQIRVDEGGPVDAGTVVLEIDPERRRLELDSARAKQAEAEAALAEGERTLARFLALSKQQAASAAKLDGARTEVALGRARADAARAQVGVAERALRDASVVAPFAGFVARRLVSRGEYVSPAKPLFDLVSLDPIEIELSVAEVDSSRVRVGSPIDVRVSPFPDEVFSARVSVVSPVIDTRSRTLRVKGELANADGRLKPGLFARADLGVATRDDVPMVPEEAVLQRADGAVVFRLVDGATARRIVVGTGVQRGGQIEVTRGLAAGDLVVVRGHADLVDGAAVQLRTPEGGDVAGSAAGTANANGANATP